MGKKVRFEFLFEHVFQGGATLNKLMISFISPSHGNRNPPSYPPKKRKTVKLNH